MTGRKWRKYDKSYTTISLTSILFLGLVDLRRLGFSDIGRATGWPSQILIGESKPGKHIIARNQWALQKKGEKVINFFFFSLIFP